MKYCFKASGHENILALHKTTFEFTRMKEISKRGDCIIGVNADFDAKEIMRTIRKCLRIRIIIEAGGHKFEANADANGSFNDSGEVVIRKTAFISSRTLGINSDMAAIDIPRSTANLLKNPEQEILVSIIADGKND